MAADVTAALLLGQGRPGRMTQQDFRAAGLLHVLAVSGLHVGLVLTGLVAVLRLLGLPWLAIWSLTVLMALGYCWFTAASIATVRATVMAVILLIYQLRNRRPHPLAAVSLAVVVLLAWRPEQAHQLGFQLSVAAVVAIVTLGRALMRQRQALLPLQAWPLDRPSWCVLLAVSRWLCDGIAIGFAASFGTAALIALHWQQAQLWSPVSSLLVAPLLVLAIGAGLLFIGGSTLLGWYSWSGIAWICDRAMSWLLDIAALVSGWPGAEAQTAVPGPWHWLAWGLLMLWPIESGTAAVGRIALIVIWLATLLNVA